MVTATDKCIVMLGCFDTKGEDFTYLRNCLLARGEKVFTIDTGIRGNDVDFPIDCGSVETALAGDGSLDALHHKGDRGEAVACMGKGAAKILQGLVEEGRVKGVIGMGGGGGTFIALSAMQAVPLGIPKLCLSTLATKDLSRQVGAKDIILMPSVVDVAGVNRISSVLMQQAAAAISAMGSVDQQTQSRGKKSIAISMFGNTTRCVNLCTELLREMDYEVMAFHATGTGGMTMESLIREGCFDGLLDVTTTELADELCGGVLSAGPDRLTAAGDMGIPQVVVPGCLDMVNFSHMDTVPEQYRSRDLYSWAPDITLLRTNAGENEALGRMLVSKLAGSKGLVEILLPERGISELDKQGERFYRPEVDRVLFDTITEEAAEHLKVVALDAHINDVEFAKALVSRLHDMITGGKT